MILKKKDHIYKIAQKNTSPTKYTKSMIIIIIYIKISLFPSTPSYIDIALYLRMKSLEWVTYDHLEIKENNRVEEMWILAAKSNIISILLFVYT